jgi:hypothetical protein
MAKLNLDPGGGSSHPRCLTAEKVHMRPVFVAILLALASASLQSYAYAGNRPLTPAENRFLPWTGEVPACDSPWVQGRIQSRFQESESEFWSSGLQIEGFDRVREIGFRSNGPDYIPRRYCSARGHLTDGKIREVVYWIGEDLGFAGGDFFGLLPLTGSTNLVNNWGVTFCVNGLDRHYAYGRGCDAARP